VNGLRRRVWPTFAVLPLVLALLPVRAAEEQISAERIRKHIEYLASPALKGRGTGTKENDKAADYIAAEFKRYGLAPASGGSYFQPFPVTVGALLGKDNRAEFAHGAERVGLRVNEDFRPLNFSSSGDQTLDLVFAGYGISAEEYRYDDYLHLDVKDKAVIVLRNEPQKDDEKSVFNGREPTRHAAIVNKAITARLRGARALVLVNDQPGPAEEDLLIKFGSITGPDDAGLLVAGAGSAALCDELAAVSPVQTRWAANDTIPTSLDVVEGRARMRRLRVNGIEVILCGLGGKSDEDGALDGVAQGCGRILKAAFA